MQTILVTGGAGYIGTHTVIELLEAGHEVIVIDNLCNSKAIGLQRVEQLTGKRVPLVVADVRNKEALREIFRSHPISAVIHFAGLKAVGESVANPLLYYRNNLESGLTLVEVMQEFSVKKLVFSSSATVYGDPSALPITEAESIKPTNPYGQTKAMFEQILRDIGHADPEWAIALLRYFNPVGAHESGQIGENPNGVPNNLMPYVAEVATGKRPFLRVWGNDYPTPDGTGVRDYIHVVDLAKGHLAALAEISRNPGCLAVNLGTGRGYSVLDMVHAFEKACGKPIPYQIMERRPGDIASCYADPTLAKDKLGWQAQYDIERMCEDAWRWQSLNPNGFE